MPNRSRIFYVALGLIFIVSIGYRIRETIDRFEFLLHPQDHVRNPFTMDLPAVELIDPEPDGTSAGLQAGDELVAFAGRPFRGAVDYYAPLRDARPGDRVNVTVRSGGAIKDVSIELKPPRDTAARTGEMHSAGLLRAHKVGICVFPALAKAGWTRHQERCCEASACGADGAVCSTTD